MELSSPRFKALAVSAGFTFWFVIITSSIGLFTFETLGIFVASIVSITQLIASKLSKNEIKISNLVAKKLKKDGIYFAGIDFISEKLNGDINVTSPTGLKNYFDLTGINLAKTFWKEIK